MGLPESLRSKLVDIRQEVERLRKAGKAKEADEIEARLKTSVDSIARPRVQLLEQSELHVVGLYEGMYPDGQGHGGGRHPQGTAHVRVKYAGQPIVLALSSYEPVKWQLHLGDGVVIKQIVLSGYYDQAVVGLPKACLSRTSRGAAASGRSSPTVKMTIPTTHF